MILKFPEVPTNLEPTLGKYLRDLQSTLEGGKIGTSEVPDAPPSFQGQSVPSGVFLSWQKCIDTTVTSYVVYRDSVKLAEVKGTTFLDPTTTRNVTYTYSVSGARETGVTGSLSSLTVAAILSAPWINTVDLVDQAVTGSKIAPGDVTLALLGQDIGLESAGFGFRLFGVFDNSVGQVWMALTSTGLLYTIQSGDRLEYDVMSPSTSVDSKGFLDLHRTGEGNVLLSQTSLSYVGAKIATKDNWVHRVITFPPDWIGNSLNSMALALDSPKVGYNEVVVKALRITDTHGKLRYSLDKATFGKFSAWSYYETKYVAPTVVREIYGHAIDSVNIVQATVTRGGQSVPADFINAGAFAEQELTRLTAVRNSDKDSIRINFRTLLKVQGSSDGANAGAVQSLVRLYRSPQYNTDFLLMTELDSFQLTVSWNAGKIVATFTATRMVPLTWVDLPALDTIYDYVVSMVEVTSGSPTSPSGSWTQNNLQVLVRST